MAYLEPVEHLRSPEYWAGIDINNLDAWERDKPATEMLSLEKLQYAGGMLLNAVRDIARGEYATAAVPVAPDDEAPLKQYPEGTVIVMDREYLLRQSNYNDGTPAWPPNQEIDSRSAGPVREPFIDHWLNAQQGHNRRNFGTDTAHFAGERQVYARALLWGVLVEGDHDMLISTYGFTNFGPQLEDDKVSLFLTENRGPDPDPFYTLTESTALARNRPYVRPVDYVYPVEKNTLGWTHRSAREVEPGAFHVEMVERTRGLQVIQTTGDYTPPVSREEHKGFLQFLDLAR